MHVYILKCRSWVHVYILMCRLRVHVHILMCRCLEAPDACWLTSSSAFSTAGKQVHVGLQEPDAEPFTCCREQLQERKQTLSCTVAWA